MEDKTYATKSYSSTRIPAQQGSYGYVPQKPVKQDLVDTMTSNKARTPAQQGSYGYVPQNPVKQELVDTKTSNKAHIPAQQGSYGYVPQNPVKQDLVDTKPSNKVRAPAVGYKNQFDSPTKFELLNEYVYGPNMSRSPKYAPTSYYEVNKSNHGVTHENSNKPVFANRVLGYSSKEYNYKQGLAGVGQARNREFYGPNQSLQSASHQGTNSGYFEESVNHLPRLDIRQRGVLDDLVTRERPLEKHSHSIQPPFVAKPNNTGFNFTNTKRLMYDVPSKN